jgi:hypothetical protein
VDVIEAFEGRAVRVDLGRARRLGDAEADAVVEALARDGSAAEVNALLERISSNGAPLPARLPPVVRRFLDDHGLPPWADTARLRRAEAFFDRNAFPITVALFCVALPMAFSGAKGAAVLDVTRRMRDDVDRRVNETGRFVFDVLGRGAFGPGGRGVRSTQKVRLMHAAVRQMARSRGGARAASGREVPINQEDLLGTLVCFSVLVVDSLPRLGVAVGRDEAEDFFHLWRVVGCLIGILPEHLPANLAEARRVGEAIRARQSAASGHGRELARVLLDGVERHLPRKGFGLVAPGLMRHLLGDRVADVLALPRGLGSADTARMIGLMTRGATPTALGASGARLGRSVLEAIVSLKLGGRSASFNAPLAPAFGASRRGFTA